MKAYIYKKEQEMLGGTIANDFPLPSPPSPQARSSTEPIYLKSTNLKVYNNF